MTKESVGATARKEETNEKMNNKRENYSYRDVKEMSESRSERE